MIQWLELKTISKRSSSLYPHLSFFIMSEEAATQEVFAGAIGIDLGYVF